MIKNKLLIVSGVNRSGKSLIAPILSSFKNVEPFVVNNNYERLLQMAYCQKVNPKFFNFYFKIMSENIMHDQFLGRNVNIKFNDFSSLWKNSDSSNILKKILNKDISKKKFLKSKNTYSHFFIHNALFFNNYFLKNFKNYKIINIIRHPIDIIFSWKKKEVYKIFLDKKKIFHESFFIKKNNFYVPYFAKNLNFKKLKGYNSYEKTLLIAYQTLKLEYKLIKKNLDNKNILIIDFDKFVVKPNSTLKKIEKILNTKRSKQTLKALYNENCPRSDNFQQKLEREIFLLKKLNSSSKKKYYELIKNYNYLKKYYD